MAIEVKHQKVSAVSDSGDSSLVQPSDWNSTHDITMASGNLLGRTSSGAGDVEELSASSVRTFLNVADGADVTDATSVTAAGAVMDSELTSLSGIKTLTVPDSTTISSFGATLIDDADAAAARTTLGFNQGLATTDSPTFAGLTTTNDITTNGIRVGKGNASNIYSTAVGVSALNSNTTGTGNTAIGYQALLNNTSGLANIAIGRQSLRDNTDGDINLAIGTYALIANTTGDGNIGIGFSALTKNTTGVTNTALGRSALNENTTGSDNLAIGFNALFDNTTVSYTHLTLPTTPYV